MAKTLIAAIKEHLTLPGETFADIRDEWQKLSDQDKKDLRDYFEAQGVEITEAK